MSRVGNGSVKYKLIKGRDGKERKREMGNFSGLWWVGKDSCPLDAIGSDKIKGV